VPSKTLNTFTISSPPTVPPANADAVVDRILSSIEKLGEFPSMARAGQVEGTREWVVPRLAYVIVYRVDDALDSVTVIAIFHIAQDRVRKR
jgi:toxin ParE1/3/4